MQLVDRKDQASLQTKMYACTCIYLIKSRALEGIVNILCVLVYMHTQYIYNNFQCP